MFFHTCFTLFPKCFDYQFMAIFYWEFKTKGIMKLKVGSKGLENVNFYPICKFLLTPVYSLLNCDHSKLNYTKNVINASLLYEEGHTSHEIGLEPSKFVV